MSIALLPILEVWESQIANVELVAVTVAMGGALDTIILIGLCLCFRSCGDFLSQLIDAASNWVRRTRLEMAIVQ